MINCQNTEPSTYLLDFVHNMMRMAIKELKLYFEIIGAIEEIIQLFKLPLPQALKCVEGRWGICGLVHAVVL